MAEWIVAICAGISVLITFVSAVIGAVVWLMRYLAKMETRILADFDVKHAANQQRYDALAFLVTRHETILNPEFSNGGKHVQRHQ